MRVRVPSMTNLGCGEGGESPECACTFARPCATSQRAPPMGPQDHESLCHSLHEPLHVKPTIYYELGPSFLSTILILPVARAMGASDARTRYGIVASHQRNGCFTSVAQEFGKDRRTVKRWIQRSEEVGSPTPRKGSGRPLSVSVEAARAGWEYLLSNKFDKCHQVAVQLHSDGLTSKVVHVSTLSRRVKAQAVLDGRPIAAKTGRPVKGLTEKNRAQRLNFCKANIKRNWSHVMITDRKKFSFSYPGSVVKRYQWLPKGQQRTASRPNHPQVVNAYAGITKYGVTKLFLVTGTSKLKTNFKNMKGAPSGNITVAEYKTVLKLGLLPCGRRLFSQRGISKWVLQQDNDPTHKRSSEAATKEWNKEEKGHVEILADWPPNSPDLSAIENAWAHVQAQMDAAGCANFEEFQAKLIKTWEGLPAKYYKSLMDSMGRRLQACIELEGGAKVLACHLRACSI